MISSTIRCAMALSCCVLINACAVSQPSPPAGDTKVSEVTVAAAIESERLAVLPDLEAIDMPSAADTMVRWGGSIASVTNLPDGSTLLEIVSRPLYSGGRPIHDDRSYGRFLALVDTFLDPEIVTAGRDMTVLASLVGKLQGKIGESDYVFPVVVVSDYSFWKPIVTLTPRHFPHWNQYPPFGHADPFRRDWPFGTRLRRPDQR